VSWPGHMDPGGPAATAGVTGPGVGERPNDGAGLSEAQRAGLWEQAIGAARQATAAVGAHRDDPAGAADVAWAASDFLASTARLVGRRGGPLSVAAEDYDWAARQAWGRLPEPPSAGSGLRAASGLLAAARTVRTPENAQLLALLAQLTAFAEAVGRMRTEQDRAVQAAAARHAAGQIRAEHHRRLASTSAGPGGATRAGPVTEAGAGRGRPPRLSGPVVPGELGEDPSTRALSRAFLRVWPRVGLVLYGSK